jgi:hypothetical protein
MLSIGYENGWVIYGAFNVEGTYRRMAGWLMNNECERILKDAIIA